jgi:hypothetical protein
LRIGYGGITKVLLFVGFCWFFIFWWGGWGFTVAQAGVELIILPTSASRIAGITVEPARCFVYNFIPSSLSNLCLGTT